MSKRETDLDVSAPDEVPGVLRNAADVFNESVGELAAAWTDPHAGKVWGDIARILERAATSVEKALSRHGLPTKSS